MTAAPVKLFSLSTTVPVYYFAADGLHIQTGSSDSPITLGKPTTSAPIPVPTADETYVIIPTAPGLPPLFEVIKTNANPTSSTGGYDSSGSSSQDGGLYDVIGALLNLIAA